MSLPPQRKGKMLPIETANLVIHFFQNNNSRIMPGMKDRVSIKKHVFEQKRLILCTLKGLHSAFRKQYSENKTGFSNFCVLRPKWCVMAGASGTHSVCVCTIHQSVVLLLHAAQMEETYKDLIAMAVCSMENKDCMLQRCVQCPSFERAKMPLTAKV